jgi:hypothetical protein
MVTIWAGLTLADELDHFLAVHRTHGHLTPTVARRPRMATGWRRLPPAAGGLPSRVTDRLP